MKVLIKRCDLEEALTVAFGGRITQFTVQREDGTGAQFMCPEKIVVEAVAFDDELVPNHKNIVEDLHTLGDDMIVCVTSEGSVLYARPRDSHPNWRRIND
jgi:hypothetical protein